MTVTHTTPVEAKPPEPDLIRGQFSESFVKRMRALQFTVELDGLELQILRALAGRVTYTVHSTPERAVYDITHQLYKQGGVALNRAGIQTPTLFVFEGSVRANPCMPA